MITKVTLLTFLVYTAVSGQEDDSTNGLATLDSSRRLGHWLPVESSGIAELPTAFLNQLRAATASKFCMQFRALNGKHSLSLTHG